MSEHKINYGEYFILAVNKALFAALISAVICLGISLLINLYFYEEVVALTIGSLGESTSTNATAILRTAGFLLGLSTFQVSGKSQIGLLILGVIPFLAFLGAAFLFPVRKQEEKKAHIGAVFFVNTVSALVYALFAVGIEYITRGDLFGLAIDFVSPRNFLFVFLLVLLIQSIISINRSKQFSHGSTGIRAIRNLSSLTLGFSSLTGILLVVYFLAPYLKGVGKIILFLIPALPNIAVYLSFLFMGSAADLGDSLSGITNYLNMDLTFLNIPTGIRLMLVIVFIILTFLVLMRMPMKKYWLNVTIFSVGFSLIFVILAIASRFDLGFVRGVLNIGFFVSPLKVFLASFLIIWLDAILLALIRSLCYEITEGKDSGRFFCGRESGEEGDEKESEEIAEEAQDLSSLEEEDEIDESESELTEIDIWKDLAARPIFPEENTEKEMPKSKKMQKENKENKENKELFSKEKLAGELPSSEEITDIEMPGEVLTATMEKPESGAEEITEKKEVDIRLFPRKKSSLRRIMDFSDMEDDPEEAIGQEEKNRNDYQDLQQEIEELEEPEIEMPEMDFEEEMEQTLVVARKDLEEELERTRTYNINHNK